MDGGSLRQHWDDRYRATPETEIPWFEPAPAVSLALIDALLPDGPRSVIDVGAGVSRLADALVERGDQVTVLDISETALDQVRARGRGIDTVRADIRTWRPDHRWDLWHDRALLHFLIDEDDRATYVDVLRQAVGPGGGFVLGTFAADGPDHCSGLPVHRFNAEGLRALLGEIEVVEERRTTHRTPGGVDQPFQWIAGRLAAG